MADIYRKGQGKRLFGLIAVGGTSGTIVASALAATLTAPPQWLAAIEVEPRRLLLIGAGLLCVAAFCAVRLHFIARGRLAEPDTAASADQGGQPVRGSVIAGLVAVVRSPYLLGICAYLMLHSLAGTFLYFRLAELAGELLTDRGDRTALFASIDLWVSVIVIATQMFLTGRLLMRVGVGITLVILPLVNAAGFMALAIFPGLTAEIVFQVE